MKERPDQPKDSAGLRPRAERRLSQKWNSRSAASGDQGSAEDHARLVHELQVHQIELEMQNEELQQTRARAETLLAQYIDLYDFAPAGYFTFDREGVIHQVNFAGAGLLGIERSGLVNRRFGWFVAEGDRPAFGDFLRRVLASPARECCELTLLREASQPRVVQLDGTRSADGGQCRAVVLDMTERKRAEETQRLQTDRLHILHEIDRGMLAAQSPHAVAQAGLDGLSRLLPCQRASVCLFDLESRDAVVLAAWSSVDTRLGAGRRFPMEDWAEELRQARPVHVEDLAAAALKGPLYQVLQAEGVRTLVQFPLAVREEVIGSLDLGADVPGAFTPQHLENAQHLADQLALGLENVRLLQQVRQHHGELKALTARLVEAGESERHRLAGELHDRVGQKLTLLSIGLDFVRSQMPPAAVATVQARLDDCQRLVAETAERTRDVMAELRPPVLDDYGVLAALRWYGGQFARRSGLKVVVHGEEPAPRLESVKETVLFRIAQEALNNTAKHARAHQVTVQLQVSAKQVWLTVADDGSGFQPHNRPLRAGSSGWGLLTMREQAEAVGGRLEVESAPGQGTCIQVEMAR